MHAAKLHLCPAACPPLPCQGDYVEILIITKDGIRREELTLKLD